MTRTTKGVLSILLLIVVYLIGYVPEHLRRNTVEATVSAMQTERAAAETKIRTGLLLGQMLMLEDLVGRSDYGEAMAQATRFFDAVRSEAQRADPARQRLLTNVLGQRDMVTAALAKADPAVALTLAGVSRSLRQALDYPVIADSPDASAASGAR